MEYKINAQLVSTILNVIANAKNTGLNWVELNNLIQQLQQLPKIEEVEKTTDKPVKPKKKV